MSSLQASIVFARSCTHIIFEEGRERERMSVCVCVPEGEREMGVKSETVMPQYLMLKLKPVHGRVLNFRLGRFVAI